MVRDGSGVDAGEGGVSRRISWKFCRTVVTVRNIVTNLRQSCSVGGGGVERGQQPKKEGGNILRKAVMCYGMETELRSESKSPEVLNGVMESRRGLGGSTGIVGLGLLWGITLSMLGDAYMGEDVGGGRVRDCDLSGRVVSAANIAKHQDFIRVWDPRRGPRPWRGWAAVGRYFIFRGYRWGNRIGIGWGEWLSTWSRGVGRWCWLWNCLGRERGWYGWVKTNIGWLFYMAEREGLGGDAGYGTVWGGRGADKYGWRPTLDGSFTWQKGEGVFDEGGNFNEMDWGRVAEVNEREGDGGRSKDGSCVAACLDNWR